MTHTLAMIPQPTPIEEIHDPLLDQRGLRLLIKRLDQVHPVISGNKWYKLKYNLLAAREQGYDTLLSFGGAYSNHIHALAGAGREYGFKTIGVIRGEPHEPLNATLQFAREQGMQLHYLSRADYRQKNTPWMIERLHDFFGDFYLLPEGGSNALAVKGAREMVENIEADVDVVACACGTGGTLAGVIAGLNSGKRALGVAVLKGAAFLRDDVQRLLTEAGGDERCNWSINLDYHFSGYAKTTPQLFAFMQAFERQHDVPLDPVYTAKLMFALYALIEDGSFERGTTLLALHTGGLQGRAGFGIETPIDVP